MKKLILIGLSILSVLTISCDLDKEKRKTLEKEVVQLKFNTEKLEMQVGESHTLEVEIIPHDADDKSLEWVSSDETIVSVDKEGTIKSLREGEVNIAVVSANGKLALCNIIVHEVVKDIVGTWMGFKIELIKDGKLLSEEDIKESDIFTDEDTNEDKEAYLEELRKYYRYIAKDDSNISFGYFSMYTSSYNNFDGSYILKEGEQDVYTASFDVPDAVKNGVEYLNSQDIVFKNGVISIRLFFDEDYDMITYYRKE